MREKDEERERENARVSEREAMVEQVLCLQSMYDAMLFIQLTYTVRFTTRKT